MNTVVSQDVVVDRQRVLAGSLRSLGAHRPAGRGQDEALTLTSIAVGSPATPLRVLPPGVQRACQRLEEGEAMAPSCLGSREGHPSDL